MINGFSFSIKYWFRQSNPKPKDTVPLKTAGKSSFLYIIFQHLLQFRKKKCKLYDLSKLTSNFPSWFQISLWLDKNWKKGFLYLFPGLVKNHSFIIMWLYSLCWYCFILLNFLTHVVWLFYKHLRWSILIPKSRIETQGNTIIYSIKSVILSVVTKTKAKFLHLNADG